MSHLPPRIDGNNRGQIGMGGPILLQDVSRPCAERAGATNEIKLGQLNSMTKQQEKEIKPKWENEPDSIRSRVEPFEIVWSQLAFEVRPSTYDKALDWTSALMRAARCGGENSSRKIKVESGPRTIFDNLNGYIKSGELTAILGPSGAGKTSLLNAICGTRTGNYRGQMRLVGGSADKKRRMRMSIIPQKDYLMENLTVRENLLFSSKILNPQRDHDHESSVARVVEMLNLGECLQSSAANISGGEYKRVSIAQELLKQPDILVLDEPTSGLDSLTCKNLIKSLVQLIEVSRQGEGSMRRQMAIVATIHQPEAEVFNMFDRVYCIARGGRVIYDGRPQLALAHIKTHAKIAAAAAAMDSTPSLVNPANLLIEIASDIYGREPIERLAREQRQQFERSHHLFASNQAPVGGLSAASSQSSIVECAQSNAPMSIFSSRENIIKPKPPPPPPGGATDVGLQRDKRLTSRTDHLQGRFWHNTLLLAQRDFKSTIRDPLMTLATFLFHLAVPLTMWSIYSSKIATSHGCPLLQRDLYLVSIASNKTVELLEDMQDQVTSIYECSYMFFLSTYCFSICSLCVSSMCFPLSMQVLLRETRNGWYQMPSYVLAKTLANLLFEVAFPAMSMALIYLLLGMPGSPYAWRVWALCLVMACISMISHTQGLAVGALCMDSATTAAFIACAITLPQAMLSGFIARLRLMPVALRWASWFSQYRYSSELTTIIRFGFGICPCSPATDEYLRSHKPVMHDLPSHLERIFVDVLGNDGDNEQLANVVNSSSIGEVGGQQMATNNSNSQIIPGIDYNFSLPANQRQELLGRMDRGELHLFEALADMISRAFTYGNKIDGCPSVVSQLVRERGTPPDEQMPFLFLGMLGILVACKLILYLTVKFRVASRI